MALLAIHVATGAIAKNPRLSKHLELIGAHCVCEGLFLADRETTAVRLRHDLGRFLQDGEQAVVVEFVGKPSFTKARLGTKDWIAVHCADPDLSLAPEPPSAQPTI